MIDKPLLFLSSEWTGGVSNGNVLTQRALSTIKSYLMISWVLAEQFFQLICSFPSTSQLLIRETSPYQNWMIFYFVLGRSLVFIQPSPTTVALNWIKRMHFSWQNRYIFSTEKLISGHNTGFGYRGNSWWAKKVRRWRRQNLKTGRRASFASRFVPQPWKNHFHFQQKIPSA